MLRLFRPFTIDARRAVAEVMRYARWAMTPALIFGRRHFRD